MMAKFRHVYGVCSGELWLARKNNCLLSSIFSSREGWLWANGVSVSRKVTPGLPGWIFFVQCPGPIFLAARWSGPATSASMFSVFWVYILRVCQSLWDSFLYLWKLHWFYICCYSIYTMLACLFTVGVRKSCVEREHGGEDGISCLLPCILLFYIEWI